MSSTDLDRMRDCPQCGALNRPRLKFCEECGAGLAPGSRSHDQRERLQAASELKRTRRAIRRVRGLYWVLAVLACAGAIGLWVATRQAWQDPFGELGPSAGALRVAAVLQSLLALTLVSGALFIMRQPFVWSLVMASLYTLETLYRLTTAETFPWVSVVIAALLWAAIYPTSRVRRLLEEHPDLRSARSFRRASLGGHLAIGLVLVATIVGGAIWAHAGRTTSIADMAGPFVDEWSADDLEAVVALASETRRAGLRTELGVLSAAEGWRRLPAPIATADVAVDERELGIIEFTTPLGDLSTRWSFDEAAGTWSLLDVIPTLGDRPAELCERWNGGRIGDVAELYSLPERGRETLTELLTDRGWERLPRLTSTELAPSSAKRIRTTHDSEAGAFTVSWEFQEGRWVVVSLRSPRS